MGSENRCSEAYRRERERGRRRRVVGSSSSSWLRDTLDANLQFKFDFFYQPFKDINNLILKIIILVVCSWKVRDMVHKSILRILIVELTRYIHEKFNQSIHVFQKVFPVCPLKQVWCLVRTNILTLGGLPLSTLASSHLSQEDGKDQDRDE